MSSWPEPGTTIGDDPHGTPITDGDAMSSNHIGRPPQPDETAGRPYAPDAESVDEDAAAETERTADVSQPPES